MKKVGQIISIEVQNYSEIKELKFRDERNRFILQGKNFCKIYDKIKGIEYSLNTDKDQTYLLATFDIEVMKNVKIPKFIRFMESIKEYHTIKMMKYLWNSGLASAEELTDVANIGVFEQNIKYKSHLVYPNNSISINNDYICSYDSDKIEFDKKKNVCTYKKHKGGIIFDYDNKFITSFNKFLDKKDVLKNIVISDTIPKQENRINFSFKHFKSLNNTMQLINTRLIIYYPTVLIIEKIIELIGQKLEKPKTIWVVLPAQSQCTYNFDNILSLLLWSNKKVSCQTSSFFALKFGKPSIYSKKGKKIVEKINYKLNDFEQKIIQNCVPNPDFRIEVLNILDKLYFTNFGLEPPKNVFTDGSCPICSCELKENQSYMPCGHVFCSECIISTIRTKNSCPCCRKLSKYRGIIISNLASSKSKYFGKLISKLFDKNKDGSILVYVDTLMLAKGLITFINSTYENDITCSVVSEKTSITNDEKTKRILICTVDKSYLCQNIKTIKNIIVLINISDYVLKPESLGYDYCYDNSDIKLWLFNPI